MVSVTMQFTEPFLQDLRSDCPVLFGLPDGGFCGNGIVVPYGHATETIAFGVGCGGACDVRTITLASGSIVTNEEAGNFTCPGACPTISHFNFGQPFGATLTDVIVDGTGIFTGASGNLNGTVTGTVLQSAVQLSGTIRLAT